MIKIILKAESIFKDNSWKIMAIFGRNFQKIIPAWKTSSQMVKLWQSRYETASSSLWEGVRQP